MLSISPTRHALARMRQRGVRDCAVAAVLEFADREVRLGKGQVALSLTQDAYRRLCATGEVGLADRVRSLVLVMADDTLVSVMHSLGRSGRHYTRQQ